jgi:hypothetical protein
MTPTKCLFTVYRARVMMDSVGAVFIYPTTDGQVKFIEVSESHTTVARRTVQ